MIGIINKELEAFIILEEIRKKYPKSDIYICNNLDIPRSIDKLIKKGCKIIILPKKYEIDNLESKKKNKVFLKISDIEQKDFYLIDNNKLLNAVINSNIKKVETILDKLNIPNEKTILINDPILLLIKKLIINKFPNKIITSIDYLVSELEKKIMENKIKCNGQTITITIY